MDNLIPEYRDPLFSIIALVFLIFLIAVSSYFWTIFKSKDDKDDLVKFLDKFNENLDDNNLDILLKTEAIPPKSLMLLASSFYIHSEYEKSIFIYKKLLKKINISYDRKNILFLLGKTYLKAGFLQRSKEAFLEVLKLYPRDRKSLQYLCFIYESLQTFDDAINTSNVLEEIGGSTKKESLYIYLLSLKNNTKLDNSKKIEELLKAYKENSILFRAIFEAIFIYDYKVAWEFMDVSNSMQIADILWNLPKSRVDMNVVNSSAFLKELYSAKGYIKKSNSSKIFEFDMLINLNKNGYNFATLEFKYLCSECKKISPFPFIRCLECLSIDTLECEFIITKQKFEKNLSLH